VLIKATAGGGGKGMRVAGNDLALKTAFAQAQHRSQGRVRQCRRLPGKIHRAAAARRSADLADQHGNVVHLWERDCSTQRRHQKLIEESPAPNLPAESAGHVRGGRAAGQEANYTNAGTVEFIVDQKNNFYFIEVNARIQVEHPVTEMVTGIDLIKAQIASPPASRCRSRRRTSPPGCGIECRINAENPDRNFQPNPGRIERCSSPADSACGSTRTPTPATRPAALRFDDRQADRAPADARPRRSPACCGRWTNCALDELKMRPKTAFGLLTGNIREGARMKLSHYGMHHPFPFGGFGDRHHERDDVAREAWGAVQQHVGGGVRLDRVWIVGDTPHDITCARAIGARVAAVATGGFSTKELAAYSPDLLLDDLSDPAPLLEAMETVG
jgi:hypothetical protein